MNKYVVRPLVFSSGERFHILQDRTSGAPLFEPTLFVVSETRANGLASATIKQVLASIMVLQLALDDLKIDIEQRLASGHLLDLNEVESIVSYCRREVSDIVDSPEPEQRVAAPKVVSLEKVRMRSSLKPASRLVNSHTTAVRVRYIRDYLNWLAKKRELRIGPAHPQFAGLRYVHELVIDAFTERIPKVSATNADEQRQGLSSEALKKLRAVIEPTSPENPWKGMAAKIRNQLIVDWLISLGLRNGEPCSATSAREIHACRRLSNRQSNEIAVGFFK